MAESKSQPGSVAVADVSNRLMAAFFGRATETQFILVPYRGFAPAYQDLAAGQIDLLFGARDQLPLMRAGSLKAYAVTNETRLTVAPDIPTFGEIGLPAISFSIWDGLFALRARRRTLSTNSMQRPSRRWPIQWCDRGSPILGLRLSDAINRHQRRSARLSRLMPKNGGR
jgi:hypothetical protein